MHPYATFHYIKKIVAVNSSMTNKDKKTYLGKCKQESRNAKHGCYVSKWMKK
jgi:hypothetical protein